MDVKLVYQDMENHMNKTIEVFRREIASIRTGRASTAILDGIMVDYYGTPTPLKQIASLSIPEPRLILIQVWDKAAIQEIEKAINKSDIGINPVVDGQNIRLNLPPLTEERRKELVKHVKKISEDSKVTIRNIRRDAIEKLKSAEKSHEISEDDLKRDQEKIQKTTDNFIVKIDQLLQIKEKEVLEF
ncbi:MAG: ribosome recycling factor [bacterium]|nr:ribosome recycling factor [bacterium]